MITRPASMFRALSILLLAAATAGAATLPAGFAETKVADGLNPTAMTFAPDGRLFLCEKQGLLRVISGNEMLSKPLFDISSKVDAWNERGLLSVCFDPDFARNGWIYVYYTHNRKPDDNARTNSNNRISRFTTKGNVADVKSELVLLELTNLTKTGWHNGGGLAFGKDGKLYISTGENATGPNAQDGTNLLGKLLRINKDGSIPGDNPHFKEYKGENRAIAALGLRNPFSIAVQRTTGLLYLSMVGANFEQIEGYDSSAAPTVVNYGWPDIDGPPRSNQPQPKGYRPPAYAYDHGRGDGVALCSGDFYDPAKPGADAFPAEYTGRFFFSDYKGWIKAIDPAKPERRYDFATGIDRPIDVDIAPDGALWYIARAGIPGGSDEANSASTNGSLWRVRWTGGGQPAKPAVIQQPVSGGKLPATAEDLPATLSSTGIFSDKNLTPKPGVVPYSLNTPAWADGAETRHWVILPDSGKVGFSPTGEFSWPGGTAFVQHFEIVTNKATRARRRLETRLLVLDAAGAMSYGATYRWRPDSSDADLVDAAGQEEVLKITDAAGVSSNQTWTYPGSGLCFMCHTPNAGSVLGPKTRQLNGNHTYPGGRTENQLLVWNRLQMFTSAVDEGAIKNYPHTFKIDDAGDSLEDRVRSYLDTNCAHCHRPNGTGALWDARFDTPLASQGILNGEVRNTFGVDNGKIVVPGDPAKSILHRRMAAISLAEQMPPLTRNVADTVALEVLSQWIRAQAPGKDSTDR
jgi:uncharacterized repeat protein (TIGR03806 family)